MSAVERAAAVIDSTPERDIGWGIEITDHVACAQALADAAQLVTDELGTWVVEALSALEAARTIGERHRTPLNYGNLDRLIDLGQAYLASRPS